VGDRFGRAPCDGATLAVTPRQSRLQPGAGRPLAGPPLASSTCCSPPTPALQRQQGGRPTHPPTHHAAVVVQAVPKVAQAGAPEAQRRLAEEGGQVALEQLGGPRVLQGWVGGWVGGGWQWQWRGDRTACGRRVSWDEWRQSAACWPRWGS
jgi:hypothetical protein